MRREIQRVLKVGNALAVVLPADLLRDLKIQRGDLVTVSCTDPKQIIIRRISAEDVRLARLGVIT